VPWWVHLSLVQSPLGWRWVLLGRRWVLEWDLPSLEQQCLGKRWGIQEPQWGRPWLVQLLLGLPGHNHSRLW
jgi:hypothetical protein